MEIIVNGEQKSTNASSVLLFLESLEIDPRRIAVEYNLEILPKNEYAATILKDGDRLEIIQFVGGGNGMCAAKNIRTTGTTKGEIDA